ncbi:uncharacterized protein IL334_001177 [Kwoniella shivajii]|uniref:Uncharacterized protein n=1 Tax=Kwoniella shivajii TaxID=564305 RepID=A0ABZ1CRG3_9TREE|nr:hypothetical protein IL334_001177 [Kwoniella shivajii]
MPLEVTPPPFAASQRLPYTPAFARTEGQGIPSGASSIGGPGPASVAASAIIPPTAGAIADPHRAVAALPEAGYTAPQLRPTVMIDPRGGGSVYGGGGGSVYGGGSMYGGGNGVHAQPNSTYGYDHQVSHPISAHHQQHHHVHAPLSVVQSDGWQANSLPAPRRGPLPPESMIAPKSHHHKHHDDFDDSKSDTSYYAMPRNHNHIPRSRCGSVSSISDSPSPQESQQQQHQTQHQGHTHRSRSISGNHHESHSHSTNHNRSPSLPPAGHFHSPISPSPLAAPSAFAGGGGGGVANSIGRSPLSPSDADLPRRHRASPGPDEDKRRRMHSFIPADIEDTHQPAVNKHRRHSGVGFEVERPQIHRHNSGGNHHNHNHTHLEPAHGNGNGNGHGHGHGHRHGHHRHRSGSHLPPPPPSDYSYSSSYQSRAPSPPPMMGGGALGVHLHDGMSYSGRRRAVSMQGLERPYQLQSYQTPSVVGGGNATVYDDGASMVSDSKMTFMDGSVAGRTSQYGLPKYPHQPKMDYRRFCVQRGNADVFLD